MSEERIILGTREQKRAMVLNRVLAGEWSQGEAAEALGLSERHLRRLVATYAQKGVEALIHGNRGRTPQHRISDELRTRVLKLAQGKYAGFNQQHLTEKLAEAEELKLGRMTVRRILLAAGLRSPRKRRPPKHRSRRERKPQEGMLLQADASPHDWLEGRGPWLTLIGGIDDATGTVPWALFCEQEDAQGYMRWLQEVVRTRGMPLALYVDRHGIFKRSRREPLTLEEELAGGPLPTQFGRVLQELDIQPIYALSPQAKGRIERLWGTFQDRLVSELRLAGACTIGEANLVLWPYLDRFNARFGVLAAQPGSAYRPLPDGFVFEQVFCFKYIRAVASDDTIRFGGRTLQLLPNPKRASYAKAQVEVQEHLDGRLTVYYQGSCVATRPAPPGLPTVRARTGARLPLPPRRPPKVTALGAPPDRRPAPDHPWRRGFISRTKPTGTTDDQT